MCDCRRPVAKDPGLDVHGFGFGVGYGHIYDPLQTFTFTTWMADTKTQIEKQVSQTGTKFDI